MNPWQPIMRSLFWSSMNFHESQTDWTKVCYINKSKSIDGPMTLASPTAFTTEGPKINTPETKGNLDS